MVWDVDFKKEKDADLGATDMYLGLARFDLSGEMDIERECVRVGVHSSACMRVKSGSRKTMIATSCFTRCRDPLSRKDL